MNPLWHWLAFLGATATAGWLTGEILRDIFKDKKKDENKN
jgi:hypothetical protein